MEAVVRIERLVKRFGDEPILRGVSVEVGRGEVAVLIGASGSGKSTLLRCVNALERFEQGSIAVGELRLRADHAEQERCGIEHRIRRRVGMVFQHFNLFPHMTALENVTAGPMFALGIPRDQAVPRAEALLDRVGLLHKKNERPGTLSGGQQQRVAIARALANEPEVILFDEPTSALDPRMTAEVLSVLADLASSGQTMLVTSHAMGFVRRSAHRVHVLSSGEVVESGTAEQILENATHPATRTLLADADAD